MHRHRPGEPAPHTGSQRDHGRVLASVVVLCALLGACLVLVTASALRTPTHEALTSARLTPGDRVRAATVPGGSRPTPSPTVPVGFLVGLGSRVRAAAALARNAGTTAGIAVYDTQADRLVASSDGRARFASASVVKVMIAARLLDEGPLLGSTAALADEMILRSNDDAGSELWSDAGGADLEPDVAAHYDIDDLGAPNTIANFWGSTQLTPDGFARLLSALRHDDEVWPWLGPRLHATKRIAADGTNQDFGLLAADPHAAVKQGWATGSAEHPGDSVLDSAGYVDHDRYAVVIFTEGPASAATDANGFDPRAARTVTAMARTVLGSDGVN